MEQLNKVELCGIVGSVRFTTVCNKRMATFSLATNYMYKDSQGCPVIETTWHQIKAWDCPEISKGSKVHVLGRLRANRYTDANGNQKFVYEVLASEVTLL